jgi:hypothetical protein
MHSEACRETGAKFDFTDEEWPSDRTQQARMTVNRSSSGFMRTPKKLEVFALSDTGHGVAAVQQDSAIHHDVSTVRPPVPTASEHQWNGHDIRMAILPS